MKYIVERVEENIAYLEEWKTGKMMLLKIEDIPFCIVEGDIICLGENGIEKQEDEIIQRKNEIAKRMKHIWIEEE